MTASAAPALSERELDEINDRFESTSPEKILEWATSRYADDTVLTCSFQHEGVALAHMLRTIKSDVPIVFINTRFHFKETIEYRDRIVDLLGLNLREVGAKMDFEEFKRRYTDKLYDSDPDLCCKINKVEPLLAALKGVKCWLNGRRRDQTAERSNIRFVDLNGPIVKVNPLANWKAKDTFSYLTAHDIPFHPLFEKGYTSIGCEPCTALPLGDDERSGRWAGSGKRECGIHTILDAGEDAEESD